MQIYGIITRTLNNTKWRHTSFMFKDSNYHLKSEWCSFYPFLRIEIGSKIPVQLWRQPMPNYSSLLTHFSSHRRLRPPEHQRARQHIPPTTRFSTGQTRMMVAMTPPSTNPSWWGSTVPVPKPPGLGGLVLLGCSSSRSMPSMPSIRAQASQSNNRSIL